MAFQKPVMKAKCVISGLRLKFAEKTWKETFELVRRCMDKSRDVSKPCEPLTRCLERLQEAVNVSSLNTMISRMEIIAKKTGMGFHFTEATCYLTADLFYLEVVLLPGGGVEEVKVALHGETPVSSESLLQLLRSKKFAEFSVKLADLATLYNIPANNETKIQLFTSLQYLGKDLQIISHLPRAVKECCPQVDMILNGRIGCLMYGQSDCPLTIQFYISPTDALKSSDSEIADMEPVIQAAQVIVGLSDVTHKLQMASLIPQPPQLDPQGNPVFAALSEMPCDTLPACFLLKLQPPLPMFSSFVNKLSQITEVAIPDVNLQWAPFPKLLLRSSMSPKSCEMFEQDNIFVVPLPGGMTQSYILPGAAWEVHAQRGTVVDSIPFTHPAHVPALLELLRHQCAINTLLSSCVSSQWASPGSHHGLHFEVTPEADTSYSMTFRRPDVDSLAVLLVNVSGPCQLTCSLFAAGIGDPSMDEYISSVMKRCMSIPVTMRELYSKLETIATPPPPPAPPVCPATTETRDDHPAPSPVPVSCNGDSSAATQSDDVLTTPLTAMSQNATAPEDNSAVPGSACYVMSVATSELPEINTSPPVNPYPFTTAGVFSHWISNNSHLPEFL